MEMLVGMVLGLAAFAAILGAMALAVKLLPSTTPDADWDRNW